MCNPATNQRGERCKSCRRFFSTVPDKYIFCKRVLSLPISPFFPPSPSTQHPQERRWRKEKKKKDGFAYEILAPLIECISLHRSLSLSLSSIKVPFSQKYSMKMTAKPSQTSACVCVRAYARACVCVLEENGICYGCLSGPGEFSGGGGGCSWGLCGGPLSRGASGA